MLNENTYTLGSFIGQNFEKMLKKDPNGGVTDCQCIILQHCLIMQHTTLCQRHPVSDRLSVLQRHYVSDRLSGEFACDRLSGEYDGLS